MTRLIQDIDAQLLVPGLSPGKRQSLIKDKTLKLGKVKALVKRVEDLANGNILTITFENKGTGERYRIIYTNIPQDDAVAHLKLMAYLQGIEIIISEIKEVQTKNSMTKL